MVKLDLLLFYLSRKSYKGRGQGRTGRYRTTENYQRDFNLCFINEFTTSQVSLDFSLDNPYDMIGHKISVQNGLTGSNGKPIFLL